MIYDVLIIGCGITGAAAAYELSKYRLKTGVLEKFNDVANGTTKANSAILHAGFDPIPGSREARLNLEGIRLAKELCEKLDVERRELPSFVIAMEPRDMEELNMLYERGKKNGVPGIRILSPEEALALEPALNPNLLGAFYAPESAIVNPWEYAVALAETAVRNGVQVHLSTRVHAIEKQGELFTLQTSKGVFQSRYVVNAGGCDSDKVHEMVGGSGFTSTHFKGSYYVLDKNQGSLLHSVVFPCPDEHGFKGVLVAPTVHGNLIVGPDAEQVEDGTDVGTTAKHLDEVKAAGLRSIPSIDFRQIIHEYAGVRPNTEIPDFIIGESPFCAHFINLAGIKSPGLSAAPAIAIEGVQELAKAGLELRKKDTFIDTRKRVQFRKLTHQEQTLLIEKDPRYGRVVCRCETITEGEIVEAIHRPIQPTTIDAIKRRCNAGMGRCQGGFCGPRVHEILARELGVPMESILMDEEGTFLLTSETKEGVRA